MEKGVEISCEKLNKGKLYILCEEKKLFSMKDRNKTENQASYKPQFVRLLTNHKSTVDLKKNTILL